MATLERTWNVAPILHIVQKIAENYCSRLYLLIGHVWWLYELYFKRYIQKCNLSHVLINTHHEVAELVNHGSVKNTKTWISWERNITFPRDKKTLNLCLRWHVLKSYRFAAEVTFKVDLLNVITLDEHC